MQKQDSFSKRMTLIKKVCILSAILLVSGFFLAQNSMAKIEKAEYSVLEKYGAIEVRLYRPYIVAETTVEGEFADVGNEGFRRLFNYISGGNRTEQSIDMTAPVGQQPQGEKIAMTAPVGQQPSGDAYLVTFMMPSQYTLQTLPEPTDARVRLRRTPEHTAVAIRYSGVWSHARYKSHKDKLTAFVEKHGLTVKGEPMWARYNPPFMPFFLRRNEILVEIETNNPPP